MVRTLSTSLLPLGSRAPEFLLPDIYGPMVGLSSFRNAKALLVVFMCRHCPYVRHVQHEIARLARDYQTKGVAIVGISPNDVDAFPEDSPEHLREQANRQGFTFPYLYDRAQHVTLAYRAACTPDFYLFEQGRFLVYHGQLDDSRPGNGIPLTGRDVRTAIDAVLAGFPVPRDQKPSMGCSIKWKPGNQPDYC
jgi:peroxiredoxin